MSASSTSEVEYNHDDEITIERKVKVVEAEQLFVRATTKMGAVDARLIAIARGEIDPEVDCDLFVMDDPFGGLIPVGDDEPAHGEFTSLDDEWLLEEVDAELDDPTADFVVPPQVIAMSATPRLCMRASELVALPLDLDGLLPAAAPHTVEEVDEEVGLVEEEVVF